MKLTLTSPGGTLEFDMSKRETSIGRGDDCDWSVSSGQLSRVHCIFYWMRDREKGDRFAIMDPGSKNGVKVDGTRLEPNQMTPVGKNSMIVLANEFILNIDVKKKVEMIDTSVKSPAPVKKKTRQEIEAEDEPTFAERMKMSLHNLLKKLLILSFILLLLAGGAVAYIMYK